MTIAYLHEKSVHWPQTTCSQRSQPPGTRPGDPRGPPETWRGRMMAWVGDPGGQRRSPSRPGLSPLPSSAAATWPHLERPAGRSVRSLLWGSRWEQNSHCMPMSHVPLSRGRGLPAVCRAEPSSRGCGDRAWSCVEARRTALPTTHPAETVRCGVALNLWLRARGLRLVHSSWGGGRKG